MKVSHIILKVDNLDNAVREYRKRGFSVEYGRVKNPINALIYFSDGPYIELLDSTHMPGFFKKTFRLLGKGGMVDRLDYWDQHTGGYCGLALETYAPTLEKELAVLNKHHQEYFKMKNKRDDTKGRKLRFQTAFPNELALPFLMTYFNIDPKPKNYVHPNGIQGITKVRFGTKNELMPIIRELCDDTLLELYSGEGIEIVWE